MGDRLAAASTRAAAAALATVSSGAAMDMEAATRAMTQRATGSPLKILHVLRAPLGGLFRHVLDVARGQTERGHHVGLVVDNMTGGVRAEAALDQLAPHLALGVARVAMTRELSPSDFGALRLLSRHVASVAPDVIHGHGGKGAALARLASIAPNAIRVYTPHGGSLFYRPGTLGGGFYRALEWLLKWRTELFLFESAYVARLFRSVIGPPPAMVRVVHNGIGDTEFAPATAAADATDLVCVGELRPIKGFDVLIAALALLKLSGRPVTATIAGEGPMDAALKDQAVRQKVDGLVRFVGYRPAREAFAMGRVLVMPSHSESLPYVLLEAAAAAVPILATRVGGIPEIFGSQADNLVAPNDAHALAAAIGAALDAPAQIKHVAQVVKARVHSEFSLPAMVEGGLAAYREAIALRKLSQFA